MSMRYEYEVHYTNKSQQYIKCHSNRLKLGEITNAEVFAVSHFCDLKSKSRSIRLVSK